MSGPQAAGWSLRTRTFRAIAGVLALLLALIVAVGYLLWNVKQTGDELVDHWDPAYQVNQNLLNAMVNEETGMRGYALGRDEALLEPYDVYTLLESGAQGTLRKYLLDEPDLMRLYDATVAAISAWHTDYADPIIAAVRADDPSADERAASADARAAFDRIRDASARLAEAVDARRAEVRHEREQAFTYLWIAGGVGTALLLLTALALARGLRRGVLRPIDGLVDQTRRVARGDLDLAIAQEGPREIQGLAADVDSMRGSLASQIARVERARERIAERSAELARSNADLEQFAYVASHDLSEPLRKVTNFCQLLERQYADQLDDKARTYIAFMVDGAKRMQILINDLLDFSRVGRTTDQFRPVDLELKLERALSNLELELQESGAVVEHDPLPTVPGDATLLTALLQNLVGNAVKYRDPERTPHVTISVEQTTVECTITVDDNGIGIEPQYAERIFQIFQRLHLRDQYGGTGIGLALCRKIVEFHRGRLWLAEKTGPGARFQFTLPTTQPLPETADDDEPALPVAT